MTAPPAMEERLVDCCKVLFQLSNSAFDCIMPNTTPEIFCQENAPVHRILACLLISVSLVGLSHGQLKTRSEKPQQAEEEPVAGGKANNHPLYLQLRHVGLQPEAIHVKDFTLKRDAGIFVFKSGTFRLLEPVNGRITGAVFTGEASFSIKPPIEVERRYLSTLTKGQPFEEEFAGAVLRFTDASEEEIRKAAVNDASSASGDANGLFSEIQQQLRKKLKENLDVRLLQD